MKVFLLVSEERYIINVYNIIKISQISIKGKFCNSNFHSFTSTIELKGLKKVISSFNNNVSLNKFVINLKVSPFCQSGQL